MVVRASVVVVGLLLVACGGEAPESVPGADGLLVPPPDPIVAPTDSVAPDGGPVSDSAVAGREPGVAPATPPAGGGSQPAPGAAPPARGGEPQVEDPPLPRAQDPAAILQRTAGIYQDMRALRADFTMQVRNPLLRTNTTSRGTLYQRTPDRLLLDFSEPEGDVIVSDGSYFWIFYPSATPDQVIRTAAASGSGGVDLQAQFVGDPTERFRYTQEAAEAVGGRPAHVFTLVPREDLGYQRLKVWIDVADGLVRRFELTEPNGTVRRIELSAVQRNPTLRDELFRFTPPPGVRVVSR